MNHVVFNTREKPPIFPPKEPRRVWSDYQRDFRMASPLEEGLKTGKSTGNKSHNHLANPDCLVLLLVPREVVAELWHHVA